LISKNSERFLPNVLYGDIIRGLPVKDNSCDGVYCSHVLEHLALEDCHRALLNSYRMMKKGLLFRMVLPDLEQCIKNYASGGGEISLRAKEFMKQTGLGQTKRPRGIYALLIEAFGNLRHRWMWDFS
jgi:ubiquinone/menaquinone biosynthesis C-methylase UbiE